MAAVQGAFHLTPPPRPRARRAPVYFDTTRLKDEDLAAAVRKAEQQDIAVLATFRAHVVLSPSRCHALVMRAGVPILLTSVRRAIATLTKAGALRKTGEKVDGPYNASEHLWELVELSSGSLHSRSAA